MRVRALLVTNSFATSTNRQLAETVAGLLSQNLELTTRATSHRGEAISFGQQADNSKFELVITLGGDGTANEVINGLLSLPADKRPAFASLPGGNANVLTRNLGYSRDTLQAARELLHSVASSQPTEIGLGKVTATTASGLTFDRYFAFNAGIGIDAEVLLDMHEQRVRGKKVSDFAYARLALSRVFTWAKKTTPRLTIEGKKYFFAFVVNFSPWTYISKKAINPAPGVTHETGLSIFASSATNARAFLSVLLMLARGRRFTDLRSMDAYENRAEIKMASDKPRWLQVDGEPLELVTAAWFTHHPNSLRVYLAHS